jgi:imidazoleglycerol-phosphate dehydratase
VSRTGDISRQTKETSVTLALSLDGSGAGKRATGVGFLDHMLDPPRAPRSGRRGHR